MVTALHRAPLVIGFAFLVVMAGCISPAAQPEPDAGPSATSGVEEGGDTIAVSRLEGLLGLTWTEARTATGVAPDPALYQGPNCAVVRFAGDAWESHILSGNLTVNWEPAELGSDSKLELRVYTGPAGNASNPRGSNHVETITLTPDNAGEDLVVDLTGWNLTSEFPVALHVAFLGPAPASVGIGHEATVTFDFAHTGELEKPGRATCGFGTVFSLGQG